eukprot:TRINITY_DN25209_c0_g1_i1.p1 TRINITY_DN25209_c0_g1~~TRINITY_DN25209_c0_g1_i1.p1  ORF type:complete len:103 (-),score=26.17 TRINITY_DN25209_c0_g1_i1:98-406(-)
MTPLPAPGSDKQAGPKLECGLSFTLSRSMEQRSLLERRILVHLRMILYWLLIALLINTVVNKDFGTKQEHYHFFAVAINIINVSQKKKKKKKKKKTRVENTA